MSHVDKTYLIKMIVLLACLNVNITFCAQKNRQHHQQSQQQQQQQQQQHQSQHHRHQHHQQHQHQHAHQHQHQHPIRHEKHNGHHNRNHHALNNDGEFVETAFYTRAPVVVVTTTHWPPFTKLHQKRDRPPVLPSSTMLPPNDRYNRNLNDRRRQQSESISSKLFDWKNVYVEKSTKKPFTNLSSRSSHSRNYETPFKLTPIKYVSVKAHSFVGASKSPLVPTIVPARHTTIPFHINRHNVWSKALDNEKDYDDYIEDEEGQTNDQSGEPGLTAAAAAAASIPISNSYNRGSISSSSSSSGSNSNNNNIRNSRTTSTTTSTTTTTTTESFAVGNDEMDISQGDAAEMPGGLTKHKIETLGTHDAVMESRRQYYQTEDQKKVHALNHLTRIFSEAACRIPRPRIISIQNDPAKTYSPHCTILHRCSNDTGCCNSRDDICVASKTQSVDLYFYVKAISRSTTIEKMTFINHTECHCVNRVSYSLSFIPESLRLQRQQVCQCPKLFEKDIQSDGTCQCVCVTGKSDCEFMKKGIEHFSMESRKCIIDGRCNVPKCEFGNYIRKDGKCPTKEDKINDGRSTALRNVESTT